MSVNFKIQLFAEFGSKSIQQLAAVLERIQLLTIIHSLDHFTLQLIFKLESAQTVQPPAAISV